MSGRLNILQNFMPAGCVDHRKIDPRGRQRTHRLASQKCGSGPKDPFDLPDREAFSRPRDRRGFLDLDENHFTALSEDQVDFAAAAPPAPRDFRMPVGDIRRRDRVFGRMSVVLGHLATRLPVH